MLYLDYTAVKGSGALTKLWRPNENLEAIDFLKGLRPAYATAQHHDDR